jgi:hypothetical protein
MSSAAHLRSEPIAIIRSELIAISHSELARFLIVINSERTIAIGSER